MKRAKKWMLVLGGVAAFLACAAECRADPFPLKGYQLGFYNGELVVSFRSTPLYGRRDFGSTTVRDISLSFWAGVAGSKKLKEVLCGYRPDKILEGTRMICHVFDLDEAGGYTITIVARVKSLWDSLDGKDWSRDDIFHSPSLLVPSSQEIAEGEDGLENDGEHLTDADADGDGVADDIDECADTPEGAEVNERGCVPSSATTTTTTTPPTIVPPGALAPVPAGAIKVDEEGCTLVGAAAFNPALFILLGAALLPIVRSRRK